MAEQAFPTPPGLSESRVALGQELVQVTDDLGLSAEGAAWVYDWSLEEWRYYLVTSLIDVKGSSWVYKRLLTAFKKLPKQDEFIALDVHLGSPNEVLFILLSRHFRSEGLQTNFMSRITIRGDIDGIVYSFETNLVLYRMIEGRPASSVKMTEKTFDYNVRHLVAT
jgi:hypothetical protein